MKKLISVAIATIILLLSLLSCVCGGQIDSQAPQRIELIERRNTPTQSIEIIRVDNHIYITTSRGGLIHSESCRCKR